MLKKKLEALAAEKANQEAWAEQDSQTPVKPGDADRPEDSTDRPSRALQVVHELHARYLKQKQRWQDYVKLFSFLAFVALFLAVLFLQRNAQVAYQVHSTIENAILPSSDEYGSTDDVLNWLQTTLTNIWMDPVCGDGVCETPFEFAAYGRFGCRADCGQLAQIQNLTTLQIDLYYDFTHPSGSVSASELMSEAAWNLCPVSGAPQGSDCYYTNDQTFTATTGQSSTVITDCPDGVWNLVLKRDVFNKVAGAVRLQEHLEAHAELEKFRLADQAADVGRSTEVAALQNASSLAGESLLAIVMDSVTAGYTSQEAALNASYASNLTSQAHYDATLASLEANETTQLLQLTNTSFTCTNVPYYQPSQAPSYFYDANGSNITAAVCSYWLNYTANATTTRLNVVRSILLNRLTNSSTALSAALAGYLTALDSSAPEVYSFVVADTGVDPQVYPYLASVSNLASFYVEGPYTTAPVGRLNLSNPAILSSNRTLADFVYRTKYRIQELADEAEVVAQLPEIVLAGQENQTETQVLVDYEDVSARPYSYNYQVWTGGATAYSTCSLQTRGPEYLGSCTPRVNCTITTATVAGVGQVTYSCSDGSDESACENTCDQISLMDNLCYCGSACSNVTQVCNCTMASIQLPADQDPKYQAIASVSASVGSPGRRLLQTSTTAAPEPPPPPPATVSVNEQQALTTILASVNQLATGQAELATNIATLGTEIDVANEEAAARATDTTLSTLISAGAEDIASGQAKVVALLQSIIGQQNSAAAAAEDAAEALAAIQNLQSQQAAAQQAIALSLTNSISAIQVALQQGTISTSQARLLFRSARQTSLSANKTAVLSNSPCTSASTASHEFKVLNYNDTTPDTARERSLGLTNRVIAGMLLHSTRSTPVDCKDSRFDNLDNVCSGGFDLAPYGIDPVFKLGTTLYNADLDNEEDTVQYYNCSLLSYKPTYDVPNGQGGYTNEAPYCAELYNARSLPYGFRSFNLRNLFGDGFPVWFDINLSQEDATRFFEYVQEGLYYDSNTRLSLVQFVTYNPELQVFTASLIRFSFQETGSIRVAHKIHTLRVELYENAADYVRLTLEVLLTLGIGYTVFLEFKAIFMTHMKTGWGLDYFRSSWHMVDFLSVGLMVVCIIIWWEFVIRDAIPFDIQLRYNVYADLQASANYLELKANGEYLDQAQAAFANLQGLVDKLAWYYALNGLNILLLIGRVLKLMDFQPRLGVVTRSLALAGPDLIHFCLVCGMVFVGYAMMGHLILGPYIQRFSTFGRSVDTCFAMLLGDISVQTTPSAPGAETLNGLKGLVGVASTLFFWTYELLVFMVLLNFLLAIIVDAFSEVKENTHETTGLHTELAQMLRERWRSAIAGCFHTAYVPDRRLGQLLKQWGGDEPLDFSEQDRHKEKRPESEKRVHVLGEEMGPEELKEALQAAMSASTPHADVEQGRGIAAAWLRKNPTKAPTEEEVEMAAAYLVSRFGGFDDEDELDAAEGLEEEEGQEGKGGAQSSEAVEKERNQLALALERLADVQKELASGQNNLMQGQRQLAEQQQRLVGLVSQPVSSVRPARSSSGAAAPSSSQ